MGKWSKDELQKYNQYRDQMDNGDLMEFATKGFIGWAIRRVTKKDVNHTALLWCVDEFKSVKNRKFIMEALEHGLELNVMSDRLKKYKGKVYWYQLKPEFDKYRDDIASICLLAEGRTDEIKYDYLSIFRQLYRKVSVDIEKNSFCSEFCQWVLQEAKVIEKRKRALRPGEFEKLGIYKPRIKIYKWS